MTIKLANNAETLLSADISASDTSFVVADASSFPTLGVGEYFYCTLQRLSGSSEIVKVTGISGNTFAVTRAQESTAAISFTAGSLVSLRVTRQNMIDSTAASIDDTAYDATTWNGVTTVAPSKNAVRDKIEAIVDDTAYNASSWDNVATVAPSKNAVRDKIEAMIDDTAYNAGTWDGVTTIAPSKNAVRDKVEAMISDTAYDAATWDSVTTIAPSKNAVRDKIETMISDTAYNATTWNGVTTVAPSQNAVRDQIVLMPTLAGTNTFAAEQTLNVPPVLIDAATTGAGAWYNSTSGSKRWFWGTNAGSDTIFRLYSEGAAGNVLQYNRTSGDLTLGANVAYRAGGTDVALADGGHGTSTATGARDVFAAKFKAHKNGTNQTGLVDATDTKITWSTEVYDVGNYFTSSKWTPPAGKVHLEAMVQLSGGATNTVYVASIYKNGSLLAQGPYIFAPAASFQITSCFVSTDDDANGTDFYEVYAAGTDFTSTGTVTGTATASWFCGYQI